MKSKQLYFYLGILLIIIPFLGLYQYLKNTIYIVIGVTLILNSRSRNTTSVKTVTTKNPIRKPAIRRVVDVTEETQKEKEL